MNPEIKRRIQIILLVALVLVTARTAYILYDRWSSQHEEQTKAAPPLNADYYVTPRKLRPYDLKSAQQLAEQPGWVREGYRYVYYPYDPVARRVDFGHEVGTLGPLEKLDIRKVISQSTPGAPGEHQIMAAFEKNGKSYAFSVGSESGGDYHIYSDDMLFNQDPHELYKHWPSDVWSAIESHQVKPGMNELQASFAIGMGVPQSSGSDKTVKYPNGGKPVTVMYSEGKAVKVGGGE